MKVLLDTHVWIWWLTEPRHLPARERTTLDRLAATRDIGLSAISLWEAQMLHARGRLQLPVTFGRWLSLAAAPETVTVVPLDAAVVTTIELLPSSFHGDPADRLIVATALAHGLPVATHDTAIRRSRVIDVWRP